VEHDLGKAVKTLNLSAYLRSCGAAKTKGYPLVHLFFAMMLLPFLKKTFTALWQHFFFLEHLRAQTDTYYRALKYQRIHWRVLIYSSLPQGHHIGEACATERKAPHCR
jgi:hypothetical protein